MHGVLFVTLRILFKEELTRVELLLVCLLKDTVDKEDTKEDT